MTYKVWAMTAAFNSLSCIKNSGQRVFSLFQHRTRIFLLSSSILPNCLSSFLMRHVSIHVFQESHSLPTFLLFSHSLSLFIAPCFATHLSSLYRVTFCPQNDTPFFLRPMFADCRLKNRSIGLFFSACWKMHSSYI